MEVKDRVVQPDGYLCPVIILADDEKEHYHGSGWAVVEFLKDGMAKVAGITYIADDINHFAKMWKDRQTNPPTAEELAKTVIDDWLGHGGAFELWFGQLSCGELCEPLPLADPLNVAKFCRVVGEVAAKY